MSEYLTEQEQIDLLKRWFKQYTPMVLLGILIAFVSIYGWRYWQTKQNQVRIEASVLYDELLTRRSQRNYEQTEIVANKIIHQYPKTVYASMAQLIRARDFVIHGQYKEAESALHAALNGKISSPVKQIIRLRLARILIADNDPKKSLEVLDKTEDHYFDGMTNEIRGDAYLKMGNRANAKKFYSQALKTLPNADDIRPLLQMKLDQLADQASS